MEQRSGNVFCNLLTCKEVKNAYSVLFKSKHLVLGCRSALPHALSRFAVPAWAGSLEDSLCILRRKCAFIAVFDFLERT
jgi:hypothetical protein